MIVCTKESCKRKNKIQQKYKGETERKFKDRISEHIGFINSKRRIEELAIMKVTILKNIHKSDPEYRKRDLPTRV